LKHTNIFKIVLNNPNMPVKQISISLEQKVNDELIKYSKRDVCLVPKDIKFRYISKEVQEKTRGIIQAEAKNKPKNIGTFVRVLKMNLSDSKTEAIVYLTLKGRGHNEKITYTCINDAGERRETGYIELINRKSCLFRRASGTSVVLRGEDITANW
jgi:hypothetical protein